MTDTQPIPVTAAATAPAATGTVAAPKAKAKSSVKTPAKAPAAAKPVATPAAKTAAPKTTTKPAKPAAKAEPVAKPAKPEKQKLVRDSFTFPEPEYLTLVALKKRLLAAGTEVKKGELVRAGLALLCTLSDASLTAAVGRVEKLKTGRPAK